MFEIPQNEVKITKELILNKVSEERILSHYLGINVGKGLFVNPLRNDKKPTASFYRNNKGDLIFKDFGNNFSGNFISVVMEIHKCSYYKCLKIIATDFGIIAPEKGYVANTPKIEYNNEEFTEKQSTSVIQIEAQEFSKKELDWWEGFGISKNTLAKFKVKSCKSVFLNGNYFCSSSSSSPIYGYYGGKKESIELWRIYMPTKRTFRFLSNWSKLQIQAANQLPHDGEYLIITKSLKDVMCLYECGVNSIAPCSETVFITQSQYDRLKLKFKKIFLLYDLDLPGVQASKRIKKEFPDLQVLLLPRKYKCKDFSDFYKKYGVIKSLDLIERAKSNYGLY